jgi:hypothetical protein
MLIFFIELKDSLLLLFILLFSLNEMEIPLITSFEDVMLENYQFIYWQLVFLKFMKVIHIELELYQSYLPNKRIKIAVSEILGYNHSFHLTDAIDHHSLSLLIPIDDWGVFLNKMRFTSIMSHNLHTNYESVCFILFFHLFAENEGFSINFKKMLL